MLEGEDKRHTSPCPALPEFRRTKPADHGARLCSRLVNPTPSREFHWSVPFARESCDVRLCRSSLQDSGIQPWLKRTSTVEVASSLGGREQELIERLSLPLCQRAWHCHAQLF